VRGVIKENSGTIDMPIGRDKKDRQKMGIDKEGKPATTHFQVLERFNDHTLVKCQLVSGRTHQIRAQVFRKNGMKSTKYVPKTDNRDNDILTAFSWYKESKEQYIKEVADSYKAKYPNFPQKLYDALYSYEVEITD
jgi:23S rRNA-/tRNA-specific pseudouridylate synthase